MHIIAYASLLFALLLSLGCGLLALLQLWQNRDDLLKFLDRAPFATAFAFLLASALLLHALFWQDYRLEYVAAYTDVFLPVFYRLTAFWAGQPGSLLFWGLMSALFGVIFMLTRGYKNLDGHLKLWYQVFFQANLAFFALMLTSWSNPFMVLDPAPHDGNGLNPLLQNPGMIFHPPLLFMGYAAFTVPACLSLAHLLQPKTDIQWPAISRPFILAGWIFLTAGIILGAWWAYMELGWGGYWAWDPVENASLLPWLAATAGLHIICCRAATGKLDRTASFLMCLTLIAAFFATWLTRSGVIQSVHAFGDGGVGIPLLIFIALAFIICSSISLFSPRKGGRLENPFGKEGALVLVAWVLLTLACIITLATMWPVFSRIGGSLSQGLDAAFYNRVCMPLAALLLVLLSFCSWLGWHTILANRTALPKILAVCGAFIASAAAIWISGYTKPLPLVASSAAIASLCAMAMHMFSSGIWARKRAIAAIGAHTGLALMAIGIAFSGPYTIDRELALSSGQTEKVGPYDIRLEKITDGDGPGFDWLGANLKVFLGAKEIGILKPERRMYAKFGNMQFSEVDVISSLGEDIYASLLGVDENFKIFVKISIEPLVNWIWLGGALMCLLPLLGIGHLRNKVATPDQA